MVGKSVLVMEFMEGSCVTDCDAIIKMGLDPADVAKIVAEVFCKQIFIDGHIHCDPHPGNLLVRCVNSKPELVLLDHGLYKTISDELRVSYSLLWRSIILGDEKGIVSACKQLNVENFYQVFSGMLARKVYFEMFH